MPSDASRYRTLLEINNAIISSLTPTSDRRAPGKGPIAPPHPGDSQSSHSVVVRRQLPIRSQLRGPSWRTTS